MKKKLLGVITIALLLNIPQIHAEDEDQYDDNTSVERCIGDNCVEEKSTDSELIMEDDETEVSESTYDDEKKNDEVVELDAKKQDVIMAHAPDAEKKKWWQFWKRSGAKSSATPEQDTKK